MKRMRAGAGFTLVECAAVLAVLAVLAAVALPSWRQQEMRAARIDAVQALTRLQLAQEQHRALHGMYAGELSALVGVTALSEQGRYALALQRNGPEDYRATATARGVQQGDHECLLITLDLRAGFAQTGPKSTCWNR